MQRKLCVIREDWHCQPWRQVPIRYHHTYTVVYAYSYTLINTTHLLYYFPARLVLLNWIKWPSWHCDLYDGDWSDEFVICENIWLHKLTYPKFCAPLGTPAISSEKQGQEKKKKRSNLSATENWCHHRYSQIDITNTKCWSPLHSPWLSEGWWDHTDSLRV